MSSPRADAPERDREVLIPLVCRSCGLIFDGNPKDPECPLCEAQEVERA